MAAGCCGIFAVVFFFVLVYFVVKVLTTTGKIEKMREAKTTTLKELVDMRNELAKKPKYLELKGEVKCEQPLLTPFSRVENVLYDFKVTQYWTTGSGDSETDHNKIIHHSKLSCPFEIVDATETIPVIIEPGLKTDIETEIEREFRDVQVIEDLPLVYENMPMYSTDISYEYTENYIPLGKRIYFIGNVEYKDERFHLKPGGDVSFISDKSEKKILRKELGERATSIRWVFFFGVLFALCFIGWYGQPEGLAEVLRNIISFILDDLSED